MNSSDDNFKQDSLFPDLGKPVRKTTRRSQNKRLPAITADQPPQSTLELALRLKLEETRARYKNYLYVGLLSTLIVGLLSGYAVDSYYKSRSDIEKNYQEIDELITSAYRADPDAHAEVVKRFPVLTKGRLPKKLKRLQANSPVMQKKSDNLNLASLSFAGQNEDEAMSEVALDAPQEIILPVIPEPSLNIYTVRPEGKKLLGNIKDETAFTINDRGEDWTSVSLNKGLPVWISAAYAQESGDSKITVTASRVGLRSIPAADKTLIVFVVDTNDTLEMLQKQDEWYRVNTPADVPAWVNNTELDRFQSQLDAYEAQLSQQSQQAIFTQPASIATPGISRESEFASAIEFTDISTPLTSLTLYSQNSEQSIVLGSIRDDAEIISIKRRGEWSSIMLSTGIPVWVVNTDVSEISSSLVEVTGQQVGLRIRPVIDKRYIVGLVDRGDKLQVLDKDTVWYQVNTPADFSAWVKTNELDSLLE